MKQWKRKMYNNGVEVRKFYENEVPEGWVLGMLPKSKEEKERANRQRKETNLKKYGAEVPLQADSIKKKVKQTCQERYGVDNVSQATSVIEKRRATFQERYGVDNPGEIQEAQEKAKQTNLLRYGVENPFQAEEVKKKIRETNLKNLGVEYPTQSKEIQEKIKQVCLDRYGVDSPMRSDEIKDRAKQTSLEKYGTEYPIQSQEVREKAKSTLMKNYGVDNPMHSDKVIQTLKETNLALYGFECTSKAPEVKEKAIKTCQEKYGVDWPCMRPEARNYSNDSGPNREFAQVLDEHGVGYQREFVIGSYSYDFKIGDTLVEIDPYATHNSLWGLFDKQKGIPTDYHLKKSQVAEKAGFRCIHVFDWDDVSKVLSFFEKKQRVYARVCEVREVPSKDCSEYLAKNHLQGSCKGQDIRLGLYLGNRLVSLMTFGKPRYTKSFQYELLRYCSDCVVVGGAEKLFKHFVSLYQPESVVSYCDRSKFIGLVYSKLGFKIKSVGSPSKHWYGTKTGKHLTDNLVRQKGVDYLLKTNYGKGTSNEEILIEHGFVPIYDCGQDTFVWEAENKYK